MDLSKHWTAFEQSRALFQQQFEDSEAARERPERDRELTFRSSLAQFEHQFLVDETARDKEFQAAQDRLADLFAVSERDREAQFSQSEAQREQAHNSLYALCKEHANWYTKIRKKAFKRADKHLEHEFGRLEDFMNMKAKQLIGDLEHNLATAEAQRSQPPIPPQVRYLLLQVTSMATVCPNSRQQTYLSGHTNGYAGIVSVGLFCKQFGTSLMLVSAN